MKSFNVVVTLFLTIISALSPPTEGLHYETDDTIVIEALRVDGQAADGLIEGQKKFRHLASIMKDGKQICAGALIDHIHILSTASCVQNITSEELSRYQVGIGYQSFNDDTPMEMREKEGPYYLRRVMKVIMDRTFYYQSLMTVRNSLVILKLDASMTFNDYVEAAQLSDNSTIAKFRASPLKTGKLSGWRKTGKDVSFLRGVVLRIHSYEECQKEYLYSKKMEDIICASNAQTNPCYYELGSPLTAKRNGRNILIGIRERDCHFPNIFTRVDYFLPWIRKNLLH
jgi:hypothetical protein